MRPIAPVDNPMGRRGSETDSDGASPPPPPTYSDRPGRPQGDRWIAAVVGILASLIGLLMLAWAILFVTKGRFLKGTFERIVSSNLAREVKVGGDFQLYFDPIDVHFVAEKMTIANPKWASKPYVFVSDRIDTRLSTFTLLADRQKIRWLSLLNGDVDLEWSPDGTSNTWTFGDPNKKGEPLQLPLIRRAQVAGTTLRYRDPRMALSTDLSIDTVKARDTRFESDVRFHGTGQIHDAPFTVKGGLLSPNATVSGGQNQLAMRIDGRDTVIEIAGTLPGATQLEGSDLRVSARGGNIARLFDFLGVATPDTRRYHIASQLTKKGEEWRFTRMKGVFGDSDLAGRMTVSVPEGRLKLKADLSTNSLSIIDVGPFIGYNPNRLDAQGGKGAIRQVGGTPRLLPDAPLRVEAIRNFDAEVRYDVKQIAGKNIPISNIGLTLSLDHSLLSLSPLTFDMAGGHLSSDIKIDARKEPVQTDYDIRLSPTPMGRLLARFGASSAGTSGTLKARVQLHGVGDTVHESLASADGRIAIIMPAGTFWTRNTELAEIDIGTFVQKMFEEKLKKPVEINCGLIAFTVRNGIAAADPILIDTSKNVMLGRGGFSFKNEALDLAFRADSKKFSLFSGQSPVGITGYFAKPGIDPISPELLGRAGAGIGLAVVATPLASVLSFVDVGDAKSAACGPVLSGASASAQRTTKGEKRDDVGRGTTAKSESGKAEKGERKEQRKKFLGIF